MMKRRRETIETIDDFLKWESESGVWNVTLLGYPIYAGVRRRVYHSRLRERVIDRQPGGTRKVGSVRDMPRKIYRTLATLLRRRKTCDILVVHERSNSASEDPYLKNDYDSFHNYVPAYYNNRDRDLGPGIDLDLLRYASLAAGLPVFIIPTLLKIITNRSSVLFPALLQCGDVLYYLLCRRYLRLVEAKTAALTVSYSHYPLIVAAKQENVLVVEYQHGMISRHHIGYVGLPEILKPDRIVCFDEIWKEHVRALGFSSTCTNPRVQAPVQDMLPSDTSEIRVLVIGQTTLTGFLHGKAKILKEQYGIIRYRPHPTETDEVVGVEICEYAERPFEETLHRYDLFVGVYSTALYEAWFSGKNILILNHPMNKFFDVLQGRPGVKYESEE